VLHEYSAAVNLRYTSLDILGIYFAFGCHAAIFLHLGLGLALSCACSQLQKIAQMNSIKTLELKLSISTVQPFSLNVVNAESKAEKG